MKPTVYLDATIPSFYYEERSGIIMQAWREITVQFWDNAYRLYDLFTSDETIRELQDMGDPAEKRGCVSRARCGSAPAGIDR